MPPTRVYSRQISQGEFFGNLEKAWLSAVSYGPESRRYRCVISLNFAQVFSHHVLPRSRRNNDMNREYVHFDPLRDQTSCYQEMTCFPKNCRGRGVLASSPPTTSFRAKIRNGRSQQTPPRNFGPLGECWPLRGKTDVFVVFPWPLRAKPESF
jgi:hypothetical protein